MNKERDDLQRLRGEFLTWVRQNEADGMEWFLAESGDLALAANASPVPEATAAAEGDDAFLAVSHDFVAGALALIAR